MRAIIRPAAKSMGSAVLMQSHPKALNARILLSSIRAPVARYTMVQYRFDLALATGCDTGLRYILWGTGRLEWIYCGGWYGPRAVGLTTKVRVHGCICDRGPVTL